MWNVGARHPTTAFAPGLRHQTINVGTQAPEIAIGELAQIVIRTVGRQLTVAALPATQGSPPRRAPDMAMARELTGFTPTVDLANGLRRTYEWYRERVFEGAGISAR